MCQKHWDGWCCLGFLNGMGCGQKCRCVFFWGNPLSTVNLSTTVVHLCTLPRQKKKISYYIVWLIHTWSLLFQESHTYSTPLLSTASPQGLSWSLGEWCHKLTLRGEDCDKVIVSLTKNPVKVPLSPAHPHLNVCKDSGFRVPSLICNNTVEPAYCDHLTYGPEKNYRGRLKLMAPQYVIEIEMV